MKTGRTSIALLAFLGLVVSGCQKNPPGPAPNREISLPIQPPGTTLGTLTFHDGVASWITTTNSFAKVNRPSVSEWFGVLYQFGNFTDQTEDFIGQLRFKGPTGDPVTTPPLSDEGTLDAADFKWVNIVSPTAGAVAPMLPEDAFALFPNSHTSNVCDMGPSGDRCLRDRRIHWDQPAIDFILTYWQSNNGYDVASRPSTGGCQITFSFRNNFEVDIYKFDEGAGAMVLALHLNSGVVGSIEVLDEGGHTHGGKHDPTWDIGQGP